MVCRRTKGPHIVVAHFRRFHPHFNVRYGMCQSNDGELCVFYSSRSQGMVHARKCVRERWRGLIIPELELIALVLKDSKDTDYACVSHALISKGKCETNVADPHNSLLYLQLLIYYIYACMLSIEGYRSGTDGMGCLWWALSELLIGIRTG